MLVHLSLGNQSASHRFGNALIGIAITTLHIRTCQCSLGRSMYCIRRCLVTGIEIAHSTAIADHQILEAPLIAQNLLQQTGIATTRFVVKTLIGTHHFAHLRILHQCLECRHIGFPHVTRRDIGKIGMMTGVFRSAMHCIVLGTSPQLAIFCVFRTLQATHNSRSHHRGKIGVLAIGFLSASPSRVSEDIHIGSPNRQAVELLILSSVEHTLVVLGTKLGTSCIEHFVQQRRIERGCHGYWFREDCNATHVGSAMQGLTPPKEFPDSQTRNGRTLIQHQLGFFLQCQSRAQVLGTLLGREERVLIGVCQCVVLTL